MPEERPFREGRPFRSLPGGRRPSGGNARRASPAGWQLLLVQSISCAVVLLIALLLRVAGGSAFEQLREKFNQSIMDNTFASTIAGLFDKAGEEAGGESSSSSGDAASVPDGNGGEEGTGGQDVPMSTVKALYAPDGATFAKLQVNRTAYRPIPEGHYTSWFGYREDPIQGGTGFHTGLDIGSAEGTPVAAMFYGVVRETGTDKSYGRYIKLYHGGGLEILYAHCSEILAEKDAVVRAGETVARVGSTGDSTGNHLHVSAFLNGTAYDPLPLMPEGLYA